MLHFLTLLVATAFASGNIIDFSTYRRSSACARALALSEAKPATAMIVKFTQPLIPHRPSEFFLHEMGTSAGSIYFFHADSAPTLRRYSEDLWSTQPVFPRFHDLYILKAYRPLTSPAAPSSGPWTFRDVATLYRPIEYTRLRISPLFSLFANAIQHFRGIHSHTGTIRYAAPEFDTSVILSQAELSTTLPQFVRGWRTLDAEEESFKQQLIAIAQRYVRPGAGEPDDRPVARALVKELAPYYSSEFIDSLTSYLAPPAI